MLVATIPPLNFTEHAKADDSPTFDPQDSDWWNAGWLYSKKITIDHDQVSSDLTNFPVCINITDSDIASDAQSELQTANTANNAYYIDWTEYAPNISSLSSYGYTPTNLSTGYIQYNHSANGQEAGYWEATARPVPCDCDEDVGRWTQTASNGTKVWRNNSELQAWRNNLGI